MPFHRVRGLTTATTATANNAIAQVWNPGTRAIIVREVLFCATTAPAAGAGYIVRRSTARGTASATITPTIAHHDARLYAPQTGFLLDTGFTAQPTLEAGELDAWMLAVVAGSGIVRSYGDGITVPPGSGLVFVNRAAVIFPVSEIAIAVDEL